MTAWLALQARSVGLNTRPFNSLIWKLLDPFRLHPSSALASSRQPGATVRGRTTKQEFL